MQMIDLFVQKYSLNKHEFIIKILEFIGEKLDEEHKSKKAAFNQRPFFRILISILHSVNHSEHFNQNTKRLILFSMADLFKSLNPSFYPGFSFAWLELISHKEFLPFFLNIQPGQS